MCAKLHMKHYFLIEVSDLRNIHSTVVICVFRSPSIPFSLSLSIRISVYSDDSELSTNKDYPLLLSTGNISNSEEIHSNNSTITITTPTANNPINPLGRHKHSIDPFNNPQRQRNYFRPARVLSSGAIVLKMKIYSSVDRATTDRTTGLNRAGSARDVTWPGRHVAWYISTTSQAFTLYTFIHYV